MTVLVVENLAKSFGAEVVFAGVSFTVGRGDRVGIVGPNGSGKTTLLETITGRLTADEGRVRVVGRPRIGYLEQEVRPSAAGGPSLHDHALEAMSGLARREERLREIETRMTGLAPDSLELPELMEEYGALRDAFEREGGYVKEARIKEVLFGLGFEQEHFGLPLPRLSGGQRTRAHLARILLEEPDLLILDEPTNHLDLQAVEWLEEFLGSYPGSVLAVSHDRYFLDHVAGRILELERRRLTAWTGNYTAYVNQKEQALVRAREAYDRQQADIERLEDYVRRYIAGNRTTMAQSRQKALGRMERLEKPPGPAPRAGIHFQLKEMTGREVLRLEGVGLAFSPEPTWLFRDVSALVRRGQRVALMGPNGTGKTTLLEVAVGRREPTAGRVVWGAGVKVGYFSQGLDNLVETRTVLEEVMQATGKDVPHTRSYLGRFLFSGDDVFKPVSALSGGERNRVVLACLVASNPNVLVLDEPTNHLDLPAREALESALGSFEGTVIFVSHDRYFVERLATRIWVLDAGTLVDFGGGYREYRLWRAESRARAAGLGSPAADVGGRFVTGPGASPATASREAGRPVDRAGGPAESAGGEALSKTLSKGRRASLERELAEAQGVVERLERRRGELETLMADPASYRQGSGPRLGAEYREVLEALEEALTRWESLAITLESH